MAKALHGADIKTQNRQADQAVLQLAKDHGLNPSSRGTPFDLASDEKQSVTVNGVNGLWIATSPRDDEKLINL
jgi:hypothetical protein